jgi:putative integral membrane protein (TIGR02587 family)
MTAAGEPGRRGHAADVADQEFWRGMAQALAGALVFALPAVMTMELWSLGFHMDDLRLVSFLVAAVPILTGMSFYAGFRPTFSWKDDLIDAFVAYAIGFAVAATVLVAFGVVGPGMPLDEVVGKIAVQAVACAIGAMLARSHFGDERDRHQEAGRERRASYGGKLFFKTVGALVLSFSLAPTEEMILIAYRIGPAGALALAVGSLCLIHGFLVAIEARTPADRRLRGRWLSIAVRYTVVGYALVLLVSAYLLWIFGRLDGVGVTAGVASIVVLGLPLAVGAGAARALL